MLHSPGPSQPPLHSANITSQRKSSPALRRSCLMTEGSARSPPGARSQPDSQHHLSTGQRTRRCSGGCRFKRELFFFLFIIISPSPCQQEEQNSVVAHAGTKRIKRGERRGERAAGAAQAGPRFKSSCAAATGVYGVRGGAPAGASHHRHPARAV